MDHTFQYAGTATFVLPRFLKRKSQRSQPSASVLVRLKPQPKESE